MSQGFKRQESVRHLKLGKRKKKLRVWRRPKGRDSKMRLKRKSYAKTVSIGYKSKPTPKPALIHNLKELNSMEKKTKIILAKVGAKKKLEIIKAANEKGMQIINLRSSK